MPLNSDVYPSIYHATPTAEPENIIEWSYPISYLNFIDNLPFGQIWDGSNSYIGFDATINGNYVGSAKHTVMKLNPNNIYDVNISETQYKKRINYRLVMHEYQSALYYAPISNTYPTAWTNIISPWFSKFLETSQTMKYYSALIDGDTTASLELAKLDNNNFYRVYVPSPITKINKDAILLYPEFGLYKCVPNYNDNGDIISVSQETYATYNYSRLKPQDNTEAGDLYDVELWEKGYKDTIDENGRIIERKIITNCLMRNVWYGNSKKVMIGSTAGTTFPSAGTNAEWTDVSKRYPSTSYAGINIVAEYYDETRNAVIYEYPNGVTFNRQTNQQPTPPVTPLYNTQNGKILATNGISPNNQGYTGSSVNPTGIMCDNSTNNVELSKTLIFPTNFISQQDIIAGFNGLDIATMPNRYYFNNDGTISRFIMSSGTTYGFSIYKGCFPLKDLLSTIASFGLFFTSVDSKPQTYVLNDSSTYDSDLYRGNFDENGVSDGTWWQGDDIPDNKLDDIEYIPDVPDNKDDDGSDSGGDDIRSQDFYNTIIGAGNNFVTLYGLSSAGISDLGKKLWASLSQPEYWQTVGTVFSNDFSINPADMMKYFISLRYFPFDLSTQPNTLSSGVYLGRAVSPLAPSVGVSFPIRLTSNVAQLDGGSVAINRYYNDFRDYEPCTSIQVSVPFCGIVDLPTSEVMGHTLYLTYKVDLQTGAMLAVIDVSSDTYYTIATIAGTCGASIPITANNNMEFLQRIATVGQAAFGGAINGANKGMELGNVAGGEVGAIGAGIGAVAGTAFSGVSALAGLPPITVHKQGNASGFANLGGVNRAFVTIIRQRYEIPDNYGRTSGYATDFNEILGKLSGFTICKNVDTTGIPCNQAEREEIKRLLEGGVYV